jgi:hypothetical protein
MRKLFQTLPLIALLAAPLTAFGGTSATMRVSFTVLASCTVNEQGATAPAVQCMQAGSYIVGHKQVALAQSAQSNTAPVTATSQDGWTVYF